MLRYSLPLLLVYLVMLFTQRMMPPLFGMESWLLGLTPVLLCYISLRAGDLSLVIFVLIGGLMHDVVLLEYFGMGPLLWGIVAYTIRSQEPWVAGSHWLFQIVICFVASFLYLCLDRLFFLLIHQYWSWDSNLTIDLFQMSLLNGFLGLLFFLICDLMLGGNEPRRRRATVRC